MDYERYKEYFNEKSNYLKTTGIRVTVLREGYAEAEMITDERHRNIHGTVHGGAFFSLADTVVGAASRSYGRLSVTLEGKLNFLSPVAIDGTPLKAVAKACHAGNRTGVYDCRITTADGTLAAQGLYTMFMLDKPLECDKE